METALRTTGQEAQKRYHRVALMADSPAQLAGLGAALRRVASDDLKEVAIWLRVDRFHATSSTHPPYRGLGRIEARTITADRVAQAESAAMDAARGWQAGWQTSFEAVLHDAPDKLANRLQEAEIDLLVAAAESRSSALGSRAAGQAACPLLLVPAEADGLNSQKTHRAPRLLRVLHG